ncbi:MAG: hypothetical protein QNI90_11080 [Dinoroseobacter sp.]|nr:hypothetical protein [Dinoroseobacter sp.]
MAPLTIYSDRKHIVLLVVLSGLLGLFLLGGTILLSWAAANAYADIPIPVFQAFLLGATLATGVLFLLGAISYWLRYRNPAPAMSLEDRGIRLMDRPPLSLAKRPVFLSWHDIASLRFERAQHGSSLSVRTQDGKAHRIIVSVLDISLEDLAEQCLFRAHKAGFIGTAEKRNFIITGHTEWRLSPA